MPVEQDDPQSAELPAAKNDWREEHEKRKAAFEARREEMLEALRQRNKPKKASAAAKKSPAAARSAGAKKRQAESGVEAVTASVLETRTSPPAAPAPPAPHPSEALASSLQEKLRTTEATYEAKLSSIGKDLDQANNDIGRLTRSKLWLKAAIVVIVSGIILRLALLPINRRAMSSAGSKATKLASAPSTKPGAIAPSHVQPSQVEPSLESASPQSATLVEPLSVTAERQISGPAAAPEPLANAVSRLTKAVNAYPGVDAQDLIREANRRRPSSEPACPLVWNSTGEPVLEFGSGAVPTFIVSSLDDCATAIEKLRPPAQSPSQK